MSGIIIPGQPAPTQTVQVAMPMEVLQSLFDFLGSLSNQEVGIGLSRWKGMTNEIATQINMHLTAFYKNLMDQGMRHRWKPAGDPDSWSISRERGWADVKTTRSSLSETK